MKENLKILKKRINRLQEQHLKEIQELHESIRHVDRENLKLHSELNSLREFRDNIISIRKKSKENIRIPVNKRK